MELLCNDSFQVAGMFGDVCPRQQKHSNGSVLFLTFDWMGIAALRCAASMQDYFHLPWNMKHPGGEGFSRSIGYVFEGELEDF